MIFLFFPHAGLLAIFGRCNTKAALEGGFFAVGKLGFQCGNIRINGGKFPLFVVGKFQLLTLGLRLCLGCGLDLFR